MSYYKFMLIIGKIIIITYMISVSVCSSRRQNTYLLFLAYKKRKASDYK